jgi:hypothetical protein
MNKRVIGLASSAIVVAAIAACSSGRSHGGSLGGDGIEVPPGGGPPESSPDVPPGTQPPDVDHEGGNTDPTVSGRDSIDPGPNPAIPAICSQAVAAFDLTALTPDASMPGGVIAAWPQAKAMRSGVPAVVLLLDQGLTDDAGSPRASAGAVHAASLVDFVFDDPPSSAGGILLVTDPPTRALTVHAASGSIAFSVSFSSTVANGFQATAIHADGTVDSFCNAFTGSVTIEVAGTRALAAFGNTTVGAAFGAPNVDTDGDGTDDSWTLLLGGTAPYVSMRLTP